MKADDQRKGARLGLILFLGLGTASAGLLAIHALGSRREPDAPLAHAEPSPEPTRLAASPSTDSAPTATPNLTPRAALDAARGAISPPPAPLPDSDGLLPERPHEAPPPEEVAAEPPPVPPPKPEQAPSPAALRAALVATPIAMYTAPWCGSCRRAHAFLQANGLRCKDLNVDDDPQALRELKARTGGTAIPVLEVDGKLLRPGFSERSLTRALLESVERRLGVKGLRLQPVSL